MNSETRCRPDVEILASIKCDRVTETVSILVEGSAPLFMLTAYAMRAVSKQHPHLAGKPIVALRYKVEDRKS
jgi:hypothetical protein